MALPAQSRTWPRVQAAVGAWVAACTGLAADVAAGGDPGVIWAHYDRGDIRKPYISLQRLTSETIGRADQYLGTRPSEVRLTVTATPGEWVAVEFWFGRVVVAAQATVALTRTALLAAIEAQTVEPLVFAPIDDASDDKITITGAGGGGVQVIAIEGCTVATITEADYRISIRQARHRVRIQLYAFDGDGAEAIDEYADALIHAMQSPDHPTIGLPILNQFGVGVEGPIPTASDVTAVSGALYERRLYLDVAFVAQSIVWYTNPVTIVSVATPTIEWPPEPAP